MTFAGSKLAPVFEGMRVVSEMENVIRSAC